MRSLLAKKSPRTVSRPSRRTWLESLESRTLLHAAIDGLPADIYGASAAVPAGKSIILPLTSTDTERVTYTVQAPSGWSAFVRNSASYQYVKFRVRYGPAQAEGDIVLQLFADIAPSTVAQIKSFITSGKYNNVPFHRVISDFMVQGGDFGDGTNPSTIGDGIDNTGLNFRDEFNTTAIFTGQGQWAMANSGKDTNGAQFFITYFDRANFTNPRDGQPRHLDFNHTIFGQVVRGWDVLAAMQAVPKNPGDSSKPADPVTVVSASIVDAPTDATVTVTAPAVAGTFNLTVIATTPDGGQTQRTISVTSYGDTVNDPPILGPVNNVYLRPNQQAVISLTGLDIDGGELEYNFGVIGEIHGATGSYTGNQITINPAANFVGSIVLRGGVKQQGATYRGSPGTPPFDTEDITITWTNDATAPTATARPSDLFASAGTTRTFTVTYNTAYLLDVSKIVNNNSAVAVTGPRGAYLPATFVSIDGAANAATRTVTYQVSAPGGVWDATDAGTYYVRILPGQVKDVLGNATGSAIAGSFFYSPTVLYNERYYLSHNTDIQGAVNQGLLPSGYDHFISAGQFEGRAPSLYYSEQVFLSFNADIAGAVQAKLLPSGFWHFQNYGMAEGRRASLFFDEFQYRLLNPDVFPAVQAGAFNSGLEHFIRFGEKEGRSASYWYIGSTYAASAADVVAAVNAGAFQSLYEHFVEFGQYEGRASSAYYVESYYRAQNPDIAGAIQAGLIKGGYAHFLVSGIREGRRASANFDSRFYTTTYPDIAQGVAGGLLHSALEHYLLYGQFEGRLPKAS